MPFSNCFHMCAMWEIPFGLSGFINFFTKSRSWLMASKPTILEATGIQAPKYFNGIQQKPIEGVSMAYTFDKAHATAPTPHHTPR